MRTLKPALLAACAIIALGATANAATQLSCELTNDDYTHRPSHYSFTISGQSVSSNIGEPTEKGITDTNIILVYVMSSIATYIIDISPLDGTISSWGSNGSSEHGVCRVITKPLFNVD
jgi:hypothetical protein